MANDPNAKREIALFPNQFLYMQDLMTGRIDTAVGPVKVNPGAQEKAVLYNHKDGTFSEIPDPTNGVQKWPFIPEGYYVQLLNPATVKVGDEEENSYPPSGKINTTCALKMGRKINIPGPVTFALWPGQHAQIIRGHQPRSNQYLLIRVYNADQAKKYWQDAKKKMILATPATGSESGGGGEKQKPLEKALLDALLDNQEDIEIKNDGDLFIIKGTQYSFFIPPTGIQVIPEGLDENGKDKYVREALTLERMEYCILVDEDGNKRYERGPQVVFPAPTEKFVTVTQKGNELRKFPAIELTRLQSIHVMVTADYQEGTTSHKTGDEILIEGKKTQIYFPRAEHRIVTYDGQQKQYATAIPSGEGRYVLERLTSKIRTIKGPEMYLPDPRIEVFVRRALTANQAREWYPGNSQVEQYNAILRDLATKTPTTRAGAVSEGEYGRNAVFNASVGTTLDSMEIKSGGGLMRSKAPSTRQMVAAESLMEKSSSNAMSFVAAAEESTRSSSYNQPRSLTLNTKLEGVPVIMPYTGFAVMVVSRGDNKRRVEVGPTCILMGYDEELEILSLSTGKPKNTDNLLRTPYLQLKSNKVSDVIVAETNDHVAVQLKYSLNVDFEDGSKEKWFSVQNYVKLLTDHVRSILKAAVKKQPISGFYLNSTDLIRDFLLGTVSVIEGKPNGKRPNHLFFPENGMRVMDVDVLETTILDASISKMMQSAAVQTVQQNIEVSLEEQKLTVLGKKEEITRQMIKEQVETVLARNEAEVEKLTSQGSVDVQKQKIEQTLQEEKMETARLADAIEAFEFEQDLTRRNKDELQGLDWKQKQQTQRLEALAQETKSIVEKVTAMGGGFGTIVASLHDSGTMERMAEAVSVQTLLGGKNLVEVFGGIFGDALGGRLAALVERASNSAGGLPNGKNSPAVPVLPPASRA